MQQVAMRVRFSDRDRRREAAIVDERQTRHRDLQTVRGVAYCD